MATGVGKRIRELRQRRGWTQDELAKRMGKTKSLISKVENGVDNLTSDKIEEYATALGCSPSAIMGWKNDSAKEELAAIYRQREHLALYVELLQRHEITKLLDSAKDCTPSQIKIATDVLKAFHEPGGIPVLKKEDEDGRT